MLSGKKAFTGPSAASVIAAILERTPAASKSPNPARSSDRDLSGEGPRSSFQNALDLKRALFWAMQTTPAIAAGPAKDRVSWVALAAAMTVIAAIALWAPWRSAKPLDLPVTRFSVDFGPDAIRARASPPSSLPMARTHDADLRTLGAEVLFVDRQGVIESRRCCCNSAPATLTRNTLSRRSGRLPAPGVSSATRKLALRPGCKLLGQFASAKRLAPAIDETTMNTQPLLSFLKEDRYSKFPRRYCFRGGASGFGDNRLRACTFRISCDYGPPTWRNPGSSQMSKLDLGSSPDSA